MTTRRANRTGRSLNERFAPSPPCACEICLGYCQRPGWWSVDQAAAAIDAGLANRMMLEPAPDRSFGVLAPAFRGNECHFAQQQYAAAGCTFLVDQRCALFGSGQQPLECRFCHHDRRGEGLHCHAALETDWRRPAGCALVVRWCKLTGLWDHLDRYGLPQLKHSAQAGAGRKRS